MRSSSVLIAVFLWMAGCGAFTKRDQLDELARRCPEPASPQFEVSGEVNHPGRFAWQRGTTVRQALQQAGGIRDGQPYPIGLQRCGASASLRLVPEDLDLRLAPGDTLVIPEQPQ